MNYQELRKLHYISEDKYKAEYNNRFNSDMTIRLNFYVNGNQAFFIQNSAVITAMYNILRLDKSIAQLCTRLPEVALQQYSKKCLIDEIVLSNNIEGVHSSRKEIGQVLAQLKEQAGKKGNNKRFGGLVNKYLKLTGNEEVPLNTCRDIRNIYDEIVIDEVASEDRDNIPDGEIFRKQQTTIRNSADKVIHIGMMPESRIIEAMEEALSFLNDESLDSIYRIALFHYLFEYIHPFYDGNGRTGRFILSYCISKELTPLLAYRISETIKENIHSYYKAFTMCDDPLNLGDITPFLIMMLKMLESSAAELKESLENKLFSWNQYLKSVIENYKVDSESQRLFYSLLIQASLFSEQGITAGELREIIKVSHVTLKNNYLDVAKQNGLLVEQKNGVTKYYCINTELINCTAHTIFLPSFNPNLPVNPAG